jgi:biopolymer transport protein TolR
MRARRKPMNQINVVPFIDVMLVLLIIFMVAAPLIQTGEVKLPTVGQGLSQPQQAIEVILKSNLTHSVRVSAGGDAQGGLTRAQAVARVRIELGKGERAVVIAADKSVSHGEVMALLSALNTAGAKRVGFLAEQQGAR